MRLGIGRLAEATHNDRERLCIQALLGSHCPVASLQTVGKRCQLPYPERYDRALEFYNNWPAQAKQPSRETQLILFGLSSQVAHGPCDEPQPSSWSNQIELEKWTAWNSLKDMDRMEAMRLFVKTLEEDEVCSCLQAQAKARMPSLCKQLH